MSCHTIMHEHIHRWQGVTIIICRHSRHTRTCNRSLYTKISSQCVGFCTQPTRSLSCTSRNMGLWVGYGNCDISCIAWRGKQRKKIERDMYGFCRNSKKKLIQCTYKSMPEHLVVIATLRGEHSQQIRTVREGFCWKTLQHIVVQPNLPANTQ